MSETQSIQTFLSEDEEWVIECPYDGPDHVYPHDWIFGGPDLTDPRADPRWRPTTYEYYDDKLILVHHTQTPLCDDQAIDEFTKIAGYGRTWNPVHLAARRPDGTYEMIPWRYDKASDTASEVKR